MRHLWHLDLRARLPTRTPAARRHLLADIPADAPPPAIAWRSGPLTPVNRVTLGAMDQPQMDRLDVAAVRAAREEAGGEEPIPFEQVDAALALLDELGEDQGAAVLDRLRARFGSVAPGLVDELVGERVEH